MPDFLFAVAATLGSRHEGLVHTKEGRTWLWRGLSIEAVHDECQRLGLRVTDADIERAIDRLDQWRAEGRGPWLSADMIAGLLMVTDEERTNLDHRTIGAIDFPTAARKARRKRKDKERKRAQRRAAGSKSRAEYLKSVAAPKPWITLGISKSTWIRRGRPEAPKPQKVRLAA